MLLTVLVLLLFAAIGLYAKVDSQADHMFAKNMSSENPIAFGGYIVRGEQPDVLNDFDYIKPGPPDGPEIVENSMKYLWPNSLLNPFI